MTNNPPPGDFNPGSASPPPPGPPPPGTPAPGTPAPGTPAPSGTPPPPGQQPQWGAQPQAPQQQPQWGAQQPPPYQQGAPAPGAPGYGAAYPGVDAGKPPRPKTLVPGILMIVGAVLALIGTVLPWASEGSVSLNGFDEFFWIRDFSLFELNSPAIVAVIGAVIMLGLGIATAAAGRVLAVTIIGIISAVLGVLGGLVLFALMADFTDSAGGSIGIGVILQPIAPIISGVGAIWATAKRRRHPGV